MQNFIKKILNNDVWKIALVIFIIELFSLISFKSAILSSVFFILILIIVLLFSLYKLEYGLYIALTELMIGSQGYLFYFDLFNFKTSIRLGIFLIVFFVWFFKYFKVKESLNLPERGKIYISFILFLIMIGIGVINGFFHGNELKNIFFDFNGYLYFGLFFIFLDVFIGLAQIINFLKILFATLIYVSIKIFFTLYIFTHGFENLIDLFYAWIRDTRVGEITWAGGNFFRIFLQSQIYSLISIFIITCLILALLVLHKEKFKKIFKNKYFIYLYLILIISQTLILISFSRSFWLGVLSGFAALFIYLAFWQRQKFIKIIQLIILSFCAGVLSLSLMLLIVNFPIPKPSGIFTASMISERLKTITGEAGVSSRWNLLPILIAKNKENLLLGSGFGTTVTYQTEDPRIKNETNPEGWYTTYTFEWGYLDTITEIGIIGLLTYIVFIGQIFNLGLKNIEKGKLNLLNVGFLLGLVVLLVTHAFSPYLNHPLGIGYLMVTASIFKIINKKQEQALENKTKKDG